MPCTSGVYQIINLVNGKIYVGSADDVHTRWIAHRHKLRSNKHYNKHLQASWNEYGEENFDFEILQIVKYKKDLINCEQFWIDRTGCLNRKYGYNLYHKAYSPLGYKHTKKSKHKMSQRWLGKNNPNYKRNFSYNHRYKIGKKFILFNDFQIRIIKRLLEFGLYQYEIANIFNVNQSTINRIKNNKRMVYCAQDKKSY